MKLIIGNKNYSSWSLRPWLLLTEFTIGFEEIQVSLRPEGRGERLRQYSPAGKVPVLIDGDLTVWDSLAICEYVNEQYAAGKGWPADTRQRAEARSISAEMHSSFQALRSEFPLDCRARKKVEPSAAAVNDIHRIEHIWAQCLGKYFKKGPWLFGRFSIADCMYAPVVLRFVTYGVKVSDKSRAYMETVTGNRNIKNWLAAAVAELESLPD